MEGLLRLFDGKGLMLLLKPLLEGRKGTGLSPRTGTISILCILPPAHGKPGHGPHSCQSWLWGPKEVGQSQNGKEPGLDLGCSPACSLPFKQRLSPGQLNLAIRLFS